jgi:hypothetical protein
MNKIKCNLLGVGMISLVSMGCMAREVPKRDDFPLVVAIEHSVSHANADEIDWTEYSVRSAELNVNGWARAFDRNSKNPYVISIIEKLQGKEYWEICYGTIVPGLAGATYCYYLGRSNYELLAAFRMK